MLERNRIFFVVFVAFLALATLTTTNSLAQQNAPMTDDTELICDMVILKGLSNFLDWTEVASARNKCYEVLIARNRKLYTLEVCPDSIITSISDHSGALVVSLFFLSPFQYHLIVGGATAKEEAIDQYLITMAPSISGSKLNIAISPNTSGAKKRVALFMAFFSEPR